MASRHPASLLLQRELGRETALCNAAAAAPSSLRLAQWAEGDLVAHCSAGYAAFQPPPRSTIALSYNCDGTLLASTQ